MKVINPLDKQRDDLLKDVSSEYEKQTTLMMMNKQVTELFTFVKNIFKFSEKSQNIEKERAGHFREQIGDAQNQLDGLKQNLPLLQQIIILLVGVAILYLVGSFLGSIIHVVAIVGLVVGVYLIVKNKNDSSSV
jgi:Flp pilus assembly protein TadB